MAARAQSWVVIAVAGAPCVRVLVLRGILMLQRSRHQARRSCSSPDRRITASKGGTSTRKTFARWHRLSHLSAEPEGRDDRDLRWQGAARSGRLCRRRRHRDRKQLRSRCTRNTSALSTRAGDQESHLRSGDARVSENDRRPRQGGHGYRHPALCELGRALGGTAVLPRLDRRVVGAGRLAESGGSMANDAEDARPSDSPGSEGMVVSRRGLIPASSCRPT